MPQVYRRDGEGGEVHSEVSTSVYWGGGGECHRCAAEEHMMESREERKDRS